MSKEEDNKVIVGRWFGDFWGKTYPLAELFMKIVAAARAIGPYAAIELLLPGGSLIVLLLWIYRTRQRRQDPHDERCPSRLKHENPLLANRIPQFTGGVPASGR